MFDRDGNLSVYSIVVVAVSKTDKMPKSYVLQGKEDSLLLTLCPKLTKFQSPIFLDRDSLLVVLRETSSESSG